MDKTILFGGLTPIHERLIQGAVESQGYKALPLPVPDNQSLAIGREYCNRGMCNPTYYTVGNLIKFLLEEQKKGINVEENYIFATIGACGPCRFGMYETEYKQALRKAGFKNFQIAILNQTTFSSEGTIELTPSLIWQLIKAIWTADILREIGYRLRPYEAENGSIDKLLTEQTETLYHILKKGGKVKEILKSLYQFRKKLQVIRFNFSKVKPVVAVIGEFWAHTTESDGNYHLHRWLEEEGAEVRPEPIAGWIDYQLFITEEKLKKEIKVKGLSKNRIKSLTATKSLSIALKGFYNLLRSVFSFLPKELPSQKYLAQLASPYFDYMVVGGEGHLEVAKHVYYVKHKKCHMVVSVKPFGCMPSTQSDGAQAKVLSDYPESIFISVETSGDAEINVKSRILMKLFEAKKLAEQELSNALRKHKITKREFENACKSENLQKPFIKRSKNYISTAAQVLDANAKQIKSLIREKFSDGLLIPTKNG